MWNRKKRICLEAVLFVMLVAAAVLFQGTERVHADEGSGTEAPVKNGFITENGKTWFYENGVMQKDRWVTVGGKEYHLSVSGIMDTSKWIQNTYYVNSKGVKQKSKWVKNTYYVNSKGVKQKSKWIKNTYYVNSKGVKQKNKWIQNTYYVNAKGVKQKEKWIQDRYYVDKNGKKVVNQWLQIGEYTYHFSASGAKDTNRWIDNRYVDSNGIYIKGAITGGSWSGSRYRQSNGVYLSDGLYYINGAYYLFQSGYNLRNGWNAYDARWYYCKADGKVAVNQWISVNLPALNAYWGAFNVNQKDKWVNSQGEFTARKHKTVKWEQVIVVGTDVREGYYRVEPKNKKLPAYYQWVKKTGNTTNDYREVNRITEGVTLAFGIGDADNPWCLQVNNCTVTRIEN